MKIKRTPEATARRMIKRIKRQEEKQKRLIDKVLYGDLSETKKYFYTLQIKRIAIRLETFKNVIKYKKRQSRGV